MPMGMTKRRPGYHNLSVQVPEVIWRKLCEESEREGESAARVLTRVLAKHYKVSKDALPRARKAGRPPKPRP